MRKNDGIIKTASVILGNQLLRNHPAIVESKDDRVQAIARSNTDKPRNLRTYMDGNE